MCLLNDLLVGVHGLSSEDSATWFEVLVVVQLLFEVLLCLATSRTKVAHQIKLIPLLDIIYRELDFSLCVKNLLSTGNISELFVIGLTSILLLLLQLVEELLVLLDLGDQFQIFVQLARQSGLQLLTQQLLLLLNRNLCQPSIIQNLLLFTEVLRWVLALRVEIVDQLLLLLATPLLVAYWWTAAFGRGVR